MSGGVVKVVEVVKVVKVVKAVKVVKVVKAVEVFLKERIIYPPLKGGVHRRGEVVGKQSRRLLSKTLKKFNEFNALKRLLRL